jgi:hypothetical protein
VTVPTLLTPIIESDTFAGGARAGINGWSPSSNGDNWAVAQGTPTLAVSSNEANMNGTSGLACLLGSATSVNAEAVVRWANVQNADELRLIVRSSTDFQNAYYASQKNSALRIAKRVNGTLTQLGTVAFTTVAGSFYWVRFRVTGSSLMARVWLNGNTEPTTWLLTLTDTSVSKAGRGGLGVAMNNGTNIAKFDNFSLSSLPATSTGSGFTRGSRGHARRR